MEVSHPSLTSPLVKRHHLNLAVDETHTFEISTESNAPVTWSVDDITRAEIEPTTGKLTAKAPGIVMVTVRVTVGVKPTLYDMAAGVERG